MDIVDKKVGGFIHQVFTEKFSIGKENDLPTPDITVATMVHYYYAHLILPIQIIDFTNICTHLLHKNKPE